MPYIYNEGLSSCSSLFQVSFSPVITDPGPPQAEKVKVSGPGVNDGDIDTFRGTFDVDTQEAGPGDLGVRIAGPSGASKGWNMIR